MSYPPQRPPSTLNDNQNGVNANNTNNNAGSSSQQAPPASSSSHSMCQSSQNQGQSPLDWTNFMNFATPPVQHSGPAGNGMRSNSGSGQNGNGQGNYGLNQQESRQDGSAAPGNNGGVRPGGGEESYQNFAQGIAMTRPSPSAINFRQPLPHRQSSAQLQPQSQQQQNTYNQPSPHQHNLSLAPSNNNGSSGPSRSPGKGKSVANQNPPEPQQDNTGLTLDADAFSRDIRFQVPQFLSNTVGGAPTFPPGGEAWSGFGANIFSADGGNGQQLTPGSMFNSAFGLSTDSSGAFGGNEQSAGGRGVLDGLCGFMGDSPWNGWDKDDGSNAMTQNMPTTFYVNPNPTPAALSSRQQQPPQQQVQQPQHPPQQQNVYNRPVSQNNGTRVPNLQVNTSQQSQHNNVPPSPRTSTHPAASPQVSANPLKRSAGTMASPHSSTSSSMPTSALFPQQASKSTVGASSYYVPNVAPPTAASLTASTINIASSSTQPYAPPPNTAALLSGPSLPNVGGPSLSDGPGLYSTTGFDIVGVLGRVAARKDPKTVLGPVDLSCSFLVVDIRRYDSPIVYASPTFEALTGYDLPQILGRNCRFLQSPEGEVVKGSKRKYTDNVAVAHLKRMLNAGKECQASLINYRRGGIPFINLVTVVPIPWEGTDIVYHVGFQVDLVEQPNAILRNMRDGTYQVNYTVANPPPPPIRPPVNQSGLGLSQEILDILGPRINTPGFGQGEEGGKMEWLKMVLENADDFVHVLSLKGLFQYVSPSVRRVLEYEPEDLLNKNISDICHPSDIVPLMRELKDSTHAPADGNSARKVHLVFRIRRKSSGYIWIECTGRLHVEAGKGRKAVILSGRAISVPTLPWSHISHNGGLSETEAWMKVSFEGLVLHATSAIQELIGLSTDNVVGESIFSFLPSDGSASSNSAAIAHLASSLRNAASPSTRSATTLRHQLYHHKRNVSVDVISVIYPAKTSDSRSGSIDSDSESPSSDASRPATALANGQRPSCLLVQIKLANAGTASRSIVHSGQSNVFEELETTRGTSWQYELHQLRLLNRRLKDDIASARAKGGKSGKTKKRKEDSAGSGSSGGTGGGGGVTGTGTGTGTVGGSMGPPPQPAFPEQYNAAPRHQLAPGFGLVAPGMSPYYQ